MAFSKKKTSGSVEVEIVDKGLAELLKTAKGLAGAIARLEVGVIGASDPETAKIAAIHEHGAPSIGLPQRAFLRGTIAKNREKIARIQRHSLGKVVDGEWSVKQALDALGTEIAADVRAGIQRQTYKPGRALKPATVARKRRKGRPAPEVPLRDTDALYNAIKHRVREA